MINNDLNLTALNTNSIVAPIANQQSELSKVIDETHDILVDVMDIIASDLQIALDDIMNDKETPEELKNLVKTQLQSVIDALNEQKTALRDGDRTDWSQDPKELQSLLTNLSEYLEKSIEKAKDHGDAFRAHDLEQKSEKIAKLSEQFKAFI